MPTLLTSGLVIEHLAHRVRNYTNLRKGLNTMDRLTEKLNQAAGVVGRVTADLESRADFIIERETAITKRGKRVFDAKNSMLDGADKGLDVIERALAVVSNDPLPSSGSSQDAPAVPAAVQQPEAQANSQEAARTNLAGEFRG